MKYNNKEIQDTIKKLEEQKNRKVPIYKGCPNSPGQCFCTGVCQEIIGYRDKIPGEL